MDNQTQCTICSKPICGTEVFGDRDCSLCWDCFSTMLAEEASQTWYGLGPHHHDTEKAGGIIGSTVLDPLPEPDANGEYDLGWAVFSPDAECPGLGVWTSKPPPGWRLG